MNRVGQDCDRCLRAVAALGVQVCRYCIGWCILQSDIRILSFYFQYIYKHTLVYLMHIGLVSPRCLVINVTMACVKTNHSCHFLDTSEW